MSHSGMVKSKGYSGSLQCMLGITPFKLSYCGNLFRDKKKSAPQVSKTHGYSGKHD